MIHALSAACSSVLCTRVPCHQAWIFIVFCSSPSFLGRTCKEKEGTLRKCSPPTSALAWARKGPWYFVSNGQFLRSSWALAGHWLEPEDQTSSPSLPLLINRHITAELGVSQSSYVAWGHTCPSCHLVPWACLASLEQEHHGLWVKGLFCCTWAWNLPGKHITSLQISSTGWRRGILCSPFMPDTSANAQPAGFSVKSQD